MFCWFNCGWFVVVDFVKSLKLLVCNSVVISVGFFVLVSLFVFLFVDFSLACCL